MVKRIVKKKQQISDNQKTIELLENALNQAQNTKQYLSMQLHDLEVEAGDPCPSKDWPKEEPLC